MRTLIFSAVVIAAGAVTARASMVAEAKAARILRHEVIIRGKVSKVGKPEEREFRNPWAGKPRKQWLRIVEVDVTKQLRGKVGKTVKVICQAPQPVKRNPNVLNQPIIARSGGPSHPNLHNGREYLLMLHPTKGKDTCYLNSSWTNYILIGANTKKRVEEIENLADTDRWGWGDTVNGLQLAVVPDRTQLNAFAPRARRPGKRVKGGKRTAVMGIIAVRNVSRKPIAISHYPGDDFLKATFDNADGKTVNCLGHSVGVAMAHPRAAKPKTPPFIAARNVTVLRPGETRMLAPYGIDKHGQTFTFQAPPERFVFTATYVNKRETKSADGIAVWQGSISASSPQISVKQPNARRTAPQPVKLKGVPMKADGHAD